MKGNGLYGGKVMRGHIRTSSIGFGDFTNFEVTPQKVYELMTRFNEFNIIPNVTDEVTIEIRDGIPTQRSRKCLQIMSETNRFKVAIQSDAIVIDAIVELKGEEAFIDVEQFLKDSQNILGQLLEVMNTKFKRISLITASLVEENVDEIYNSCVVSEGYFSNKEIIEWGIRKVSREIIPELLGEQINVVSTTDRAKGHISSTISQYREYQFDGVVHEIDINTIAENIDERIDKQFVERFYDIAATKIKEIEGVSVNE